MHSSGLDYHTIETKSCRYGTISYLKRDLLIGRALHEYGEWAQAEIDFLLDLVGAGSTIIDVGAFIGTHTIAFARHVGSNGKVYAFEPRNTMFELLSLNVEQNKLFNVKLFNVALSDVTGTTHINEGNLAEVDNPGKFSLYLEAESVSVDINNITIVVATLDQYHIDSCDLIKIDVEGMELRVLKGAAETLQRCQPMVLAECVSLHNGWQIVTWMKERGYHALLHNELSYNPDNFRKNSYNFLGEAREANIIFVPEDRMPAFEKHCRQFKKLIPIPTLDDFALGLLRKPQYKYEVLAHTKACQLLGIDFIVEGEVNQLQNELAQQRIQFQDEDNQLQNELVQQRTRFQNKVNRLQNELAQQRTRFQNKVNRLQNELAQQRMQFQDEVNRLQNELAQQRMQFQDYVKAIHASWSWRITSPLRFMVMLLRHLFRGEIRIVLEETQAIEKRPREKPPDDIALHHAMTFFRHDAGDTPPLDQEVDIVIPVYNGMPYLTKLTDSLLRNTDSPYRLILIDDASPDPDIQPFLQNIVQQFPSSVLIRNPQNKGYVQSVNTALQQVRNHFVLLNTDTEVPKGWLQRLMRPIVEDANIASTTPFTNAGTVCSFPHMNVDNEPFDNLAVDEIDAFFKLVNPEAVSIKLPSGIGFCMGMNFNVWQQIGPFNESIFGSGYGEENDWSMRAHNAGYHNIMVPNLFVYHKSGVSFGQKTKQRQQQQNLPKVLKLHPTYLQEVDDLIKRDPAKPIRQFLALLLSTHQASAGTTLLIDHQWGGGANTYRQEVIRERLAKGEAVLLFMYNMDHCFFRLQCLYKEYNVNFMVSGFNDILQLLEWVSCKEIFYNNLVTFPKPLDILHKIYNLKKNSRVNLTITLHDYFCICPSYNLLNSSGIYCDLSSLEACRTCLPRNRYAYHATDRDVERWRKTWGDVLEVADTVLCFSECSRTLLTRTYPLRPEQITVKPHQLPVHFTKKPKINLNGPMNIGVVGSIGYEKGSEIVGEMARILENRVPEAKITVIGTLSNAPRLNNLMVTGPYKTSELPGLIEKYGINICLLPSICPETCSYVCSELMELGMPLCCFELGAQGERVSKYRLGHTISRISAPAAAEETIQFFINLKPRVE